MVIGVRQIGMAGSSHRDHNVGIRDFVITLGVWGKLKNMKFAPVIE